MRRGVAAVALTAAILLGAAGPSHATPPPIKHVFIVVLENENADTTFGASSKAPYLAKTLRSMGQFMPNYFGTGHLSLDNYIAMVSGQGPNVVTQADAPAYTDVLPGLIGADGQAMGHGSVYPASVKTIADQLHAKGLAWRGFLEDMGNSATDSKTCRHPAIGAADNTQSARQGDQYAMRHNPFVYFHSIIDDAATCNANDVPLDRLPGDLASASTTPSYSFIVPNLCHDGHDEPCKGSNEPGGLVSANAFLQQWIPQILASPGYKAGGLVIVTLDEAIAQGSGADASSCCNEPTNPANTPNNGGPTPGSGGGRVGAVLISQYVAAGSFNPTAYNHYTLLGSMEDLFQLAHLGYAGRSGLKTFGGDVYTNPTGNPKDIGPPPTVSLTGMPHQCVRRAFRVKVRVHATNLRSTLVFVDNRTVRSGHKSKLDFAVSVKKVSVGRHRLRVRATDGALRRASRSGTFTRCNS